MIPVVTAVEVPVSCCSLGNLNHPTELGCLIASRDGIAKQHASLASVERTPSMVMMAMATTFLLLRY